LKKLKESEKYKGKSVDAFNSFREKIACARLNYDNGRKKRKGLTLSDAAGKIGISSAYLSQLENGQRSTPNAGIVYRIERIYGFESGELARTVVQKSKETA
jgi:hypothetical protein